MTSIQEVYFVHYRLKHVSHKNHISSANYPMKRLCRVQSTECINKPPTQKEPYKTSRQDIQTTSFPISFPTSHLINKPLTAPKLEAARPPGRPSTQRFTPRTHLLRRMRRLTSTPILPHRSIKTQRLTQLKSAADGIRLEPDEITVVVLDVGEGDDGTLAVPIPVYFDDEPGVLGGSAFDDFVFALHGFVGGVVVEVDGRVGGSDCCVVEGGFDGCGGSWVRKRKGVGGDGVVNVGGCWYCKSDGEEGHKGGEKDIELHCSMLVIGGFDDPEKNV